MIRNDEELARARQRLELIRDELAMLSYDIESGHVVSGNRRTHNVMREYFVQRIEVVQSEIDAYLAARGEHAVESSNAELDAVYGKE